MSSRNILGDNQRKPVIYTGDNSDLIKIANSVKDVRPKNKGKDKPHEPETSSGIIIPSSDLSFINKKENYDELKKYFKAEFPIHKEKFDKLIWDPANNIATGSSTYIAIATDMYHKKYMPGYRLARQVDLEADLEEFIGHYVDSGLALRSIDGKNAKKAKPLYEQLQKRTPNIQFPVWIDLRGLTLDPDLNINLTDESTYKTAECLNWINRTNYSQTDDFGLPSLKDETATRTIWTLGTKKGLAECYLDGCSDLDTKGMGFAYSNSIGRVVLAKLQGGTA